MLNYRKNVEIWNRQISKYWKNVQNIGGLDWQQHLLLEVPIYDSSPSRNAYWRDQSCVFPNTVGTLTVIATCPVILICSDNRHWDTVKYLRELQTIWRSPSPIHAKSLSHYWNDLLNYPRNPKCVSCWSNNNWTCGSYFKLFILNVLAQSRSTGPTSDGRFTN